MSGPPPLPCDEACQLLKILLDNQGNLSRLEGWVEDVKHLHQCKRESKAEIPVALGPLLPAITDKTQQIHDLVKEIRQLWREGHGG